MRGVLPCQCGRRVDLALGVAPLGADQGRWAGRWWMPLLSEVAPGDPLCKDLLGRLYLGLHESAL